MQLFLDEELVVVEGKVIFKPGISRFLTARRIADALSRARHDQIDNATDRATCT